MRRIELQNKNDITMKINDVEIKAQTKCRAMIKRRNKLQLSMQKKIKGNAHNINRNKSHNLLCLQGS